MVRVPWIFVEHRSLYFFYIGRALYNESNVKYYIIRYPKSHKQRAKRKDVFSLWKIKQSFTEVASLSIDLKNFLDMDMECKNRTDESMNKERYKKLQGCVSKNAEQLWVVGASGK